MDMSQSAHSSSRSPWASEITSYKQAQITPVTAPISGSINVPGSKSYTNRALIVAGLAQGKSELTGFLKSDDSYWCLDALKRLGLNITVENEKLYIQGCAGNWPQKKADLFIGAAGTIARFLPGALAVSQDGSWHVDGVEQLRGRPLSPLITALRSLGAHIDFMTDNEGLPLKVEAHGLQGGDVQIPGNVSSQFLSGLLIASPYAQKPVQIKLLNGLVQPSYVRITTQLMEQFGASIEHLEEQGEFIVQPTGYEGRKLTLEADASTACYFLSIAALTQGTIRVQNVGYRSYQPDAQFIDVLERMGCSCIKNDDYLEVTGPAQLRGGFDVDMKPMSDQAITIGALAPFADKPIRVYNVAHIRQHESDRISVICQALRKMGIEVEEFDDGFKVYPGTPQGALIDPHDDHRNAMAFALIGLKVPLVRIADPGCVSKTCPTYFSDLKNMGVDVHLN